MTFIEYYEIIGSTFGIFSFIVLLINKFFKNKIYKCKECGLWKEANGS